MYVGDGDKFSGALAVVLGFFILISLKYSKGGLLWGIESS